MVNADSVNYVKKQLDAGYTEKEIRDALIKTGWSQNDIDDAFRSVQLKESSQQFMSDFEIKSDIHLQTNIDKLYALVRDNGAITLGAATSKLGASKERVKDWADILENHRMIDIDYPFIGDPIFKTKKGKVKKKEPLVKEKHARPMPSLPKLPIIPIILIAGFAALLYLTSMRYTVLDAIITTINQNPQVLDAINSMPYGTVIMQNMIHVVFLIYTLLVILIFLIIRLVTRRGSRKKKPHEIKAKPKKKEGKTPPKYVSKHEKPPKYVSKHEKKRKKVKKKKKR